VSRWRDSDPRRGTDPLYDATADDPALREAQGCLLSGWRSLARFLAHPIRWFQR
jgi:hypothetical protein